MRSDSAGKSHRGEHWKLTAQRVAAPDRECKQGRVYRVQVGSSGALCTEAELRDLRVAIDRALGDQVEGQDAPAAA